MVTVTNNNEEPRRRGRPRKWSLYDGFRGDVEEYWKGAANDPELSDRSMMYSRRQQENIVLAFRARDRIKAQHDSEHSDRAELAWAVSEAALRFPRSVLTELGRIEDEDVFWRAALWCARYAQHYRAHDVARCIREFRLGTRITLPGEPG
jgi:hypothetical protein